MSFASPGTESQQENPADDPTAGNPVLPKQVPYERHFERADYDMYGQSRALYNQTGDPESKMLPNEAAVYRNLTDQDRNLTIVVVTVGRPSTLVIPDHPHVSNAQTVHGFTATEGELDQLKQIGTVATDLDPLQAVVKLTVATKEDIGRVAALDFVYSIHMPAQAVQAA